MIGMQVSCRGVVKKLFLPESGLNRPRPLIVWRRHHPSIHIFCLFCFDASRAMAAVAGKADAAAGNAGDAQSVAKERAFEVGRRTQCGISL
jgi:hypothetical protein